MQPNSALGGEARVAHVNVGLVKGELRHRRGDGTVRRRDNREQLRQRLVWRCLERCRRGARHAG
eukprot:6908539-Prymnesium_polylepis.1